MDQAALMNSVADRLQADLDALSSASRTLSVSIPYGATRETKLLLAEWLVHNFEGAVRCVWNRHFVLLAAGRLLPANVYYIDVTKILEMD